MLKLLAFALLCVGVASGALTTVQDTLYDNQLHLANCTLFITPSQSWITAQGKVVRPNPLFTSVVNGALSVQLEDNTTSVPSGTFYNVQYTCGSTFSKVWVIPSGGGPVGIATVEAGGLVGTSSLIAASQLQGINLVYKYFGTAPPGNVAGNLPGDMYYDTAAHNAYKCGAVSTTPAPACTSVTVGGWEIFVGSGTVTNLTTACGVVGGPITTTGTIKESPAVVVSSSTSYTFLTTDCGLTYNFTGASPAITVPSTGVNFPNGWHVAIAFTGSGNMVLTTASGTINGASSTTVAAANGAGGFLRSDGTNWEFIVGSVGSVTHTAGALTANLPVIGNGGGDVTAGTRSGNTTQFATTLPSAQPVGKCLEWDASGNIVTAVVNAACGSGGGGGSSMASQLLDFGALKTSATVITIGTNCSNTTPCLIRNGTIIYVLTTSFTITLSGTLTTGTVYIYLANGNVMTVGHNTGATLTCSAGCTVTTGVSGVPPDAVAPLWALTFTTNVWDTIAPSTMDLRAVYSNRVIISGSGIFTNLDPTTGNQTISTDPNITPRYFVGSGAPGINCTAGRDFYTDTGGQNLYFCYATNLWKQPAAGAAGVDRQSFPLVTYSNGAFYPAAAITPTNVLSAGTATGPNSISYLSGVALLNVNDFVMVAKKSSSTWTGAAGTVDIGFTVVIRTGDIPAAGNWNFSAYVGCAAPSSQFTYGTASTISFTPATTALQANAYYITGLNLPASCAANRPMQFWIQRNADTGGSTLANAPFQNIEVVIRGN